MRGWSENPGDSPLPGPSLTPPLPSQRPSPGTPRPFPAPPPGDHSPCIKTSLPNFLPIYPSLTLPSLVLISAQSLYLTCFLNMLTQHDNNLTVYKESVHVLYINFNIYFLKKVKSQTTLYLYRLMERHEYIFKPTSYNCLSLSNLSYCLPTQCLIFFLPIQLSNDI